MYPKNTPNIVSKATSWSLNKSAISTIVAVILTAIIAGSVVGGAVYAYFALQFAPAQQLVSQPKPALEKFKAGGYLINAEQVFLVIDAGKERGIWASLPV